MADRGPDIFDRVRLPPEIDAHLREVNPWWQGLPGRVLPPYRRWVFATMLRRLDAKVAPAIVLRGARQVGKTRSSTPVRKQLGRSSPTSSTRP